MNFGKRLKQESDRKFGNQYFDYEGLDKQLKEEFMDKDNWNRSFAEQLEKVNKYFIEEENKLAADLYNFAHQQYSCTKDQLTSLCSAVNDLVKFQQLNYLAVIKIVENFNKNTSVGLDVTKIICGYEFSQTTKLLHQTQILRTRQHYLDRQQPKVTKEAGFECPICLEELHAPVRLPNCKHLFCWGCISMHYVKQIKNQISQEDTVHKDTGEKELNQDTKNRQPEAQRSPIEVEGIRYTCPVCRQNEIIQPEKLPIDRQIQQQIFDTKNHAWKVKQKALMQHSSNTYHSQQYLLPEQNPRHRGQLTLCLDLDNTLVYVPQEEEVRAWKGKRPKQYEALKAHAVHKLTNGIRIVVERPGLKEFLQRVSEFSEVVIFTSAVESYAKPIVEALDPEYKWISAVLYRDSTVESPVYPYVKDLSKLGRQLNRTVLVDDNVCTLIQQPDNGILASQFKGDPDDDILLEVVLPLLQLLSFKEDIRPTLNQRYSLRTLFGQLGYTEYMHGCQRLTKDGV
eukprot:TRINITY_DN7436_c0_g1_i4.p1 TRINITY_DN7436_c0_g1~~TRINITY_DN7436_c0_g1_i4.p1  ORF type:complete len:511 (+),score=41.65 TRINITY_DN7436_c0_g1_i4:134-1666(+)